MWIWGYVKGKLPFCVRVTSCRQLWVKRKTVQQELSFRAVQCHPRYYKYLMAAWDQALQTFCLEKQESCLVLLISFWAMNSWGNSSLCPAYRANILLDIPWGPDCWLSTEQTWLMHAMMKPAEMGKTHVCALAQCNCDEDPGIGCKLELEHAPAFHKLQEVARPFQAFLLTPRLIPSLGKNR